MKVLIGGLNYHDYAHIVNDFSEVCEVRFLQFDQDNRYFSTGQKLIDLLPENWLPDLFIWWLPEYFAFPLSVEDVPFPTVAAVSDWNLGFNSLRENLKRFDYIVTDKLGVEKFRNYGYENVGYWILSSFYQDPKKSVNNGEREYDITFIGNMNSRVQQERARWLKKVALLGNKYNVRIFSGVYCAEYTAILENSKIIFNRSIRLESNLRVFEATVCASLLFMEEENLEIQRYLRDRHDCILYNENNLEELLQYYLEHSDERISIARSGQERIKKETYKRHFIWLLKMLKEQGIIGKTDFNRPFSLFSSAEKNYHYGLSLLQEIHKFSSEIPNLFKNALLAEPQNINYWNAFAVSLAICNNEFQVYEKSVRILKEAISLAPSEPLIYLNLGTILIRLNRFEESELFLKKCLEIIYGFDSVPFLITDVFFPYDFDYFRVSWERFSASGPKQKNLNEEQIRLIEWKTLELLGDLALFRFDSRLALDYFRSAIELFPSLSEFILLKSGRILSQLEDYSGSVGLFRQACEINIFNDSFWYEYLDALQKNGDYQNLLDTCNEFLLIIKASNNYSSHQENLLNYKKKAESFLANL